MRHSASMSSSGILCTDGRLCDIDVEHLKLELLGYCLKILKLNFSRYMFVSEMGLHWFNSFWSSDNIWRNRSRSALANSGNGLLPRSGSTLAHVMVIV